MDEQMIYVRRALPSDGTKLAQIFDDEVGLGYAIPYMPTSDWWTDRVKRTSTTGLFLVALFDEELIGFVELHDDAQDHVRRHSVLLGICVKAGWRNRGIGRSLLLKALEISDRWLAFRRIELYVWAEHLAAVNLYESVGFVQEGLHRKYGFRDGKYCDVISMARLRDELDEA